VNNVQQVYRIGHHQAAGAVRKAPPMDGSSFAAMLATMQAGGAPPVSAGKGGHGGATGAVSAAGGAYGSLIGRSTGSGQCVALVRATNPALGSTANWVRGAAVQGNTSLPPGTPIATFAASGRYANATDGSSHAALYLGQNAQGVQVLDQWSGSPAAVRTIPWNNPGGAAANTGSAFHVVTAAPTQNA
jgi:hypothetical protein